MSSWKRDPDISEFKLEEGPPLPTRYVRKWNKVWEEIEASVESDADIEILRKRAKFWEGILRHCTVIFGEPLEITIEWDDDGDLIIGGVTSQELDKEDIL